MIQNHLWIFSVGIVGQLLFSARMIVQWLQSEKKGKPLSPVLFWQLSLLGAMVFFLYGILRKDFAIVIGQLLVYFIYIRNLHLKNKWFTWMPIFRWIVYLTPVASLVFLFSNTPFNFKEIIGNTDIPLWLKIWGTLGQLVFTSRFFLQLVESESQKESVLSINFWIISLAGSTMILSYAVFRLDPVLFFGQVAGAFVYSRNLILGIRSQRLLKES
jgi:lipid-A-disaccharide synthase-like uncharacterized protein